MISDLNVSLGSRQFLNVANERTWFASCAPGWSLLWNALLTKKLPVFLSRVNEINGGCEKILPVSGLFWSNLKSFRVIDFTAWLWGWMEFYYHSPSETFERWLPINLLGALMARLNNRGLSKKSHISSDFKEKSEFSLQRRRSLRNWE